MSIWVPKNAEFYAYSKSEDEIENSAQIKIYLEKTSKRAVFCK